MGTSWNERSPSGLVNTKRRRSALRSRAPSANAERALLETRLRPGSPPTSNTKSQPPAGPRDARSRKRTRRTAQPPNDFRSSVLASFLAFVEALVASRGRFSSRHPRKSKSYAAAVLRGNPPPFVVSCHALFATPSRLRALPSITSARFSREQLRWERAKGNADEVYSRSVDRGPLQSRAAGVRRP